MAEDSAARGAHDLQPLSDLRYSVAEDEADVRGWPVVSSAGDAVGTVADLLVDANAGEVVAMDIARANGGPRTLAPVRDAYIDRGARRVVLDARSPGVSAVGGGVPLVERRADRVDDASMLDDAAGIDPRELDAQVRIEEGATVDDEAPVAGVRYESAEHTPHDYGRPDEAYGPEYGDGRIGFDKVVGRDPALAGAPDLEGATGGRTDARRVVRYRRYPDAYAGPDASG